LFLHHDPNSRSFCRVEPGASEFQRIEGAVCERQTTRQEIEQDDIALMGEDIGMGTGEGIVYLGHIAVDGEAERSHTPGTTLDQRFTVGC